MIISENISRGVIFVKVCFICFKDKARTDICGVTVLFFQSTSSMNLKSISLGSGGKVMPGDTILKIDDEDLTGWPISEGTCIRTTTALQHFTL